MPRDERYCLFFDGHDEPLNFTSRLERPPTLIRLGDKSLWQFKRQTWSREEGYSAHYKLAIISEFNWLFPTNSETSHAA
jgi:hypothetical protein